MKQQAQPPYIVESITDLHRMLGLPGPLHPLVSVINMDDIKCHFDDNLKSVAYNFYSICTKRDFTGKLKYGRNYYDFDEGFMTFFSPGQVISTEVPVDTKVRGMWLVVHPDFMRNSPLGKKIKEYGFFSYAVHEALHLSEREEEMINALMQNVAREYDLMIDSFSQDVMLSHIDLILNYSNRFYGRQFNTRKTLNNDLLIQLEQKLDTYFENIKEGTLQLPTVKQLAAEMNMSASYLSDMLRSLTGQNTQQHIHNRLIEKAKQVLATTPLSVGEIAYSLGFEYPQSFNKLFKNKTGLSPLEYRKAFN